MSLDMLEFRTYAAVTESHEHDFWQIVLPVAGSLDMEVGGRAGAVRPGQGAVIPAGTRHAFQASGANRFLVADVRSLAPEERSVERFSRDAFFGMEAPVRALIDYRMNTVAPAPDMAGHWCSLLLAALGEMPGQDRAAAQAVERAVRFMQSRLAEPITVADMADAAGLSVHRLNAAFRRVHGTSPYAHLTRLRFEQALHLLAETRLPIAEIAELTGHADQSALTRRLKKLAGTSPAVYRRAGQALSRMI